MATVTVTGFTAARALEIEESAIVGGRIVGDNLILTTRSGDDQTAGNVRGPKGNKGDAGGVWDATDVLTGGVRLAGNLGGTAEVPKVKGNLESTVDLSAAMIRATVTIGEEPPQNIEFSAAQFLAAVVSRFNDPSVNARGEMKDLWLGTLADYNALPSADKNRTGFVAVIR